MRKIAITGGIGSGKSVVSSVLRIMGFSVYDCDSEAKNIMNTSIPLKKELCIGFGKNAVIGEVVNKEYISSVVFNNKESLERLNSIVHPYVLRDFEEWTKSKTVAFVETAILFESGMDKLVDEIWIVDAPVDIRIKRVMKRNGLSEEEVIARVNSQNKLDCYSYDKRIKHIFNDDKASILNQIMYIMKDFQK